MNAMNWMVWTVLGLTSLGLMPKTAEAAYSRTYNGAGYKYRTYGYYSRTYKQYRQHYVVQRPGQRRYAYYYNPYTRKYWGRYDYVTRRYSLLADADKRSTLAEIPESAFPPGGAMPPAEPEDPTPMPPPPEPEPEPTPTPTPRVGSMLPPSTSGCRRY